MNYILQITNDDKKIRITKEEAEIIAKAPDDKSITISRLGVVVQKRMVMIYPEQREFDDKTKQINGVLSDGTMVKKYFGQWVDANSVAPDDSGNYHPVRLDPVYYPEIALDKVLTTDEYEKIKHLPLEERKKIICGEVVDRISSQEPKQLKDLL